MKKRSFEHWTIWSGVFEIFTVGGIFYGWPAYVFILKEEEVFYDLCNATVTAPILNNMTQPDDMVKHCVEQDTFFNMLFVVGCALSNICGMLFGYVLDNYGLFACRMMTSGPLSLALILMIFYKNGKALIIGVELLAFSAIGTLLTNITLQPIWPDRTSAIGSMFSGAFDGSSATFMIAKVIYERLGVPLKSIATAMACMSIIHWARTMFLLPVKVIPRELPSDYDLREETFFKKKSANQQLLDKDIVPDQVKLRSNRDDSNASDRELEMSSTPEKSRLQLFFDQIKSLQFVALAAWYCLVSLRINSFQFWFNPSLQWMFPDQKSVQSNLTNIFGITYIMSLPISPLAGVLVDFFAKRYRQNENNELKGRAYGVAFVCGICSVLGAVVSYLASFQANYAIAVTSQIIFSVVRTFLYAILAQAAFLLFPHELFGLIYGFLNLLNGLCTFLADPIFRFIHTHLDGDFAPVHYVLTVTTLLTILYPVVLVRYGRSTPQQ